MEPHPRRTQRLPALKDTRPMTAYDIHNSHEWYGGTAIEGHWMTVPRIEHTLDPEQRVGLTIFPALPEPQEGVQTCLPQSKSPHTTCHATELAPGPQVHLRPSNHRHPIRSLAIRIRRRLDSIAPRVR